MHTTVAARTPSDLLLVAVGRGDRQAFAALYDDLAPTVVGIVRRVVRDPHQSDEVSQEVFLEVWRTADRYDRSRGSARAWVTTMAHRRAIDRVRSEQSERNRRVVVGAQRDPGDLDPTAATATDHRERAGVALALERLSSGQRDAISLAYYEGHTYAQVARLLGVPEGTVKSRIRQGLHRLREALEPAPAVAAL